MSVGTITVRDKSGAAEASFNVDLAAPLSEVAPQLSRELGAVVGPNEAVLPILERSGEALTDPSRSLSSYGVQDGDVILLGREIVGGSADTRALRIAELERSFSAIAAASKGNFAWRRLDGSRYALTVSGIPALYGTSAGDVSERRRHEITVSLPAAFPQQKPRVTVSGSPFHPNVWPGGDVCYVWRPAWSGTEFVDAILRLLRGRSFNPGSPANKVATAYYVSNARRISSLAATPASWSFPLLRNACQVVQRAS